MSNDRNPPVWTSPVIRFIEASLPVLDPKGEEWEPCIWRPGSIRPWQSCCS